MARLIFDTELTDLYSVDKIEFTPEQTAASMVFKRGERFIGGYSHKIEMIKLCNSFFGENPLLEKTGLIHQFKEMRKRVIEKALIGLVLCGLNEQDTLIQNYTQENLSRIKLTVASITRTLIREYFTEEEVQQLCRDTPNFSIYYKPLSL